MSRRLSTLFLLGALLGLLRPATADLGPCLTDFAALTGDEDHAPDLVSSTYGALLDRFGLELTPETLAKMRASQNPFLIPDQKGADVVALRKHVKGLEELVEAKHWRTPDVIARLSSNLDARIAKIAETKNSIARGLRQNGDFDFKVRTNSRVVQSPDGRYFLSAPWDTWNTGKDLPWIEIFDSFTEETKTIPRGEGELKAAHFSANGRELRFFLQPSGFGSAPFENGTVVWEKRKMIPTPLAAKKKFVTDHSTSPDPDVYLAGSEGMEPAYLVNAKEQKAIPVDLRDIRTKNGEYNERLFLRGWGYIPGSDRVYFRVRDGHNEATALVAKVSPNGVITRESVLATFPLSYQGDKLDPHELTFSNDGKKAYFHGTKDHDYLGVSAGPGTPIKVLKSYEMGNRHQIAAVLSHPTESVVLVMMYDLKATPPKKWVEVIDTHTNTKKTEVPLPEWTGRAEISPDGAHLNVFGPEGEGKAISLVRHLH